jgi:hypothetical protein
MLFEGAGQLGFEQADLGVQFDDDSHERTHDRTVRVGNFSCGLKLRCSERDLDFVGTSSNATLATTRPQQPLDRPVSQCSTSSRRRCMAEHRDGVTCVQIRAESRQCGGIELAQGTA